MTSEYRLSYIGVLNVSDPGILIRYMNDLVLVVVYQMLHIGCSLNY